MQKVKKVKQKMGAVLLSIVVAMSIIFVPSVSTPKKVSANTETENMNQLEKWTLISRLLNEEAYFDEGKVTNEVAAIYTAAEYYWENEDQEEDKDINIPADEFCNAVRENFAGKENFDTSALESIEENDFFKYDDSDEGNVYIKKLGQGPEEQCTYLGESEDEDTLYGIWTNPAENDFEPYYVALDLKDGKIASYRKLAKDAVTFQFDIYEEDEETEEPARSFTTSKNKVFIPQGTEAKADYWITIRDENGEETKVSQFTTDNGLEDIFKLNMTSSNSNIARVKNDQVIADKSTGTANIKYEIKEVKGNNTIYQGTLPCTSYKLSINGCKPDWWVNILPGMSMDLKVNMEGYDNSKVKFVWNSSKYNIKNVSGQTCKVKAPSSVGEGKLTVTPYIDNEPLEDSYEQLLDVRKCNLSLTYRHFIGVNTEVGKGTTLKAGDSYWFYLNDGDFGWDFGNGSGSKRQTFYKIECKLNGKTLTATEVEKNLKNNELSIGIGAGGGCPNRIITPKKSGKLTIKATLYRNGKYFKSYSKTYTVKKFTVKKTSFKSAKNAKGKKIALKWKKNTSGTGYQIQYATDKKFKKECKTKTISKNKTTSYTIKSLKKKKTYYVRIRTYKKLGNTYHSGWSSAKKVKINK